MLLGWSRGTAWGSGSTRWTDTYRMDTADPQVGGDPAGSVTVIVDVATHRVQGVAPIPTVSTQTETITAVAEEIPSCLLLCPLIRQPQPRITDRPRPPSACA